MHFPAQVSLVVRVSGLAWEAALQRYELFLHVSWAYLRLASRARLWPGELHEQEAQAGRQVWAGYRVV